MSIWRDLKDGINDVALAVRYIGRQYATREQIEAAQAAIEEGRGKEYPTMGDGPEEPEDMEPENVNDQHEEYDFEQSFGQYSGEPWNSRFPEFEEPEPDPREYGAGPVEIGIEFDFWWTRSDQREHEREESEPRYPSIEIEPF